MWGAKPKARKAAAGGKENARKQQRVAQPAEPPRAPAEQPATAEPARQTQQPAPEDIPVERPAGADGIDRSSGALARAADPVQRARAAAAAAPVGLRYRPVAPRDRLSEEKVATSGEK